MVKLEWLFAIQLQTWDTNLDIGVWDLDTLTGLISNAILLFDNHFECVLWVLLAHQFDVTPHGLGCKLISLKA